MRNKIGRGSGEARLYVGSQAQASLAKFFSDLPSEGFFLKKDLQDYLADAKFEYEEQAQGYIRDISKDWEPYRRELVGKPEVITFTFDRAPRKKDKSRYYIRSLDSEDALYDFFRRIALPVITDLAILKLEKKDGTKIFYFKPFLNYDFNQLHHPAREKQVLEEVEQNPSLSDVTKRQIIIARKGQGKYREGVLDQIASCPITGVDDERILIAGHIKPWSISTNREKVDPNNGIMLTPTYDRMFDQGFISFDDKCVLLVSPYISTSNLKKLNLTKGKKYSFHQTESRKKYLDYHRKNIFNK